MPDMGDPKRLALDLVQAGAQRHVEIIEHDLAEMVGVMTFRHHHAGECGRIRVWILALGFQSPRLNRRARRRAEALVAGGHTLVPPPPPHSTNRFYHSTTHWPPRRAGNRPP